MFWKHSQSSTWSFVGAVLPLCCNRYSFTYSPVWGFLCFLLLLAIREHRKEHTSVWYTPTPMYPWFNSASGKLPYPATSRSRGRPTTKRNTSPSEKPLVGSGSKGKSTAAKPKSKRPVVPDTKFTPRPPRRAHTLGGRDRVDKYARNASPRR